MLDLILLTKTTEKIGLVQQKSETIELAIDRPDQQQQLGSIFLGKVMIVDQSLQAVFVDIGQDQLAYLEIKEIPQFRKDQTQSIESLVYEGQSLIVQIMKDAYQDKGARITMNVTIANHVLVYLPFGNYVAVSKKLNKEQGRNIKEQMTPLCEGEEGLIIRTSATDYSIDQLTEQVAQLRTLWKEISAKVDGARPPACIHEDNLITDRLIRRFSFEQINQIYVDQASSANQIKTRYPDLARKVSWEKEIESVLNIPIDKLLQSIIHTEVVAKSGVTVVIDHTEALTVIDVNSSGFTGKMNQHHFSYKVNQIALKEIAKQIRLRNISGMIVVDFLRMKEKKHKEAIRNQFKQAVTDDPTRTQIYGFTDLGLFELTRKREAPSHRLSLAERFIDSGEFSLESKVYQLERELIATRDEAVLVEMTEAFRKVWDQLIDSETISQHIQTEVNFLQTKGVKDFHIKRSGSAELINEFVNENKKLKVDKLN